MGTVHQIYIAHQGSDPMEQVQEAEAVANEGLRGDRYCERLGYYTGLDECQLTLIQAEDLEEIQRNTGLHVLNGEHRRNIVTRDVQLAEIITGTFQVGDAVLAFDRPRPPCAYIQSITETGMTQALMGKAGICTIVVKGGLIRAGDAITFL
jgi:MOSC domain-containing protein YiiM